MSNYWYSTGVKRPRCGGEKARGRTSQGAKKPGGEQTRGESARHRGRTS